MQEMTMEALMRSFKSDWSKNSKYVGISVIIEGATKPEVIINSKDNFESKRAYYEKAYDENLKLKFNPAISIVRYTFGNSYEEIQANLGV